jgi:hypothetical protein
MEGKPLEHHRRRHTRVSRKRVAVLQRRARHLRRKAGSDRSAAYNAAELAALEWAIPILEDWMADDPRWVRTPSGRLRHLNWPYYERAEDKWLVTVSAATRRQATDAEIEQVMQGDEICP